VIASTAYTLDVRSRSFVIGCLFALSLGCGEREPAPPQHAEARKPASDTPRDGGTLVRRLVADIVTLNPVRGTSGMDRRLHKYLYTPIIYLDRNLQPVPGIAKTWTISPDGRIYRFEVNPKATFSDGRRVLARDVLFTLRKIVDPTVQAPLIGGFFEELDLSRTRVIDDRIIEVSFHRPFAHQLVHFAHVFVIPEHVYSKGDFNSDFNDVAIGSGPYRLTKLDRGKEIVIDRRGDYWGNKPHIQTVVFKVIADNATAWNALKLGQLDETEMSSDNWVRERSNTAITRTVEFRRFYTLNYNFIGWNNRRPLLSDKRIRRALAMCIPLDAITRDIFQGTARPVSGPFTPDEYAFNPSVPLIAFNPAAAKRIFTEAGWRDGGNGALEKDGRTFAVQMLIIQGSASSTQVAQAVQAELKKIGVQLEIRALDGAGFMQHIRRGNYDAAYLAWDLDADPDPHSLFHSAQVPPRGQNFVFYSNPEADRLIDAARRELDVRKRKDTYWQLHAVLSDDQPYAWLVQVSTKWGTNKRLRGVTTSPAYGTFGWYPGEFGWWIQRS
jgi:peptide/nickel transport system substrate-binding protein